MLVAREEIKDAKTKWSKSRTKRMVQICKWQITYKSYNYTGGLKGKTEE
jgi:hypothetical protein